MGCRAASGRSWFWAPHLHQWGLPVGTSSTDLLGRFASKFPHLWQRLNFVTWVFVREVTWVKKEGEKNEMHVLCFSCFLWEFLLVGNFLVNMNVVHVLSSLEQPEPGVNKGFFPCFKKKPCSKGKAGSH